MKKRYMLPILGALASIGFKFWMNKKDKNGESGFMKELNKAGKPDQMEGDDQAKLENAKMVSEGSQFGVQYYNKTTN